MDGAVALNKGQRVQEIGYLVGILASKANGMMDLDRRWLALRGRKCPPATLRANVS